MTNWRTKTTVFFLISIVVFLVLIRFQGLQYIAAYSGSGFAKRLPDETSFAKKAICINQPIEVMSFNVMYGSATIEAMAKRFRGGNTGQGELPWSMRLPEIRERIISYSPDLLGLQETEKDTDIGSIVPMENYSLVTYHLGALQYGDAALLFKTSRFEQMDSGQVWLGPTPNLPMSLGFSPLAMIRYINWVILRDKSTGFVFMFVNTHFDNASKNKDPSAILFHDAIATLAKGFPIIVSGDFNTRANTERYLRFTGSNENPVLLENTYDLLRGETTFGWKPDKLIDHILVGGPCMIEADQWLVDTRPLKNGLQMSDHNLIFAKLRFLNFLKSI
jgi:endonuclease/exonuclease/phosphatase family metal-dependent hydrolase